MADRELMAEDGRNERFEALIEQIEDAFNDANVLGQLRQQIAASDLGDREREALDSRISQYLIDMRMRDDPRERRGRGEEHGDPYEVSSGMSAVDTLADEGDEHDDDDLTGEWAPVSRTDKRSS